METETTYEGWSNRATWLADLEDARAHGEIIRPRMIGAQ